MFVDMFLAPFHERSNRRRCGVKNRNLVTFYDIPKAIRSRVIRRTLVHHHGRAIGHRTVNDIAMSCDPTTVGGTPVDILVTPIEHPLKRLLGPQVVSSRRV